MSATDKPARRRRRRRRSISAPLLEMPQLGLRLLGLSHSVPKRPIGKTPGTLPDLPEHEREPARVSVIAYGPDSITEERNVPAENVGAFRDAADVCWVNVVGVRDPDALLTIGKTFGLHPLVMEDVAHTHQRPKLEHYPDEAGGAGHMFVVLKMLHTRPGDERVRSEQVAFVIGSDFLLTFQEEAEDVFEPVRDRLRSSAGRVRRAGPDFLAYALIDVVVDHYFAVIEALGEHIDALEQLIMEGPEREHQEHIRALRRNVLFLRRAIWPLRDVLNMLQRDESGLVTDRTRLYLRDVYDHTIQVVDFIESFRDVLSTLSDLYVSSLSHRLNEVMKVLTIVGTIFIPLSFLTGIYGMNFEHMPELGFRYAYPIFLTAVAMLLAGSLLYFRRRGWI